MPTTPLIVIGRLGASHGVKGWLKLISLTDPTDNIFHYQKHWQIRLNDHSTQPLVLENQQVRTNNILIKIKNIDDCDQAKTLTNKEILIPKEVLPTLDDNQFYWNDLIGLEVINQQSINLGQVDHLFATGSNDVLVVKQDCKKRLLPYIESVILSIDLQKQIILVDWDPDF